MKQIYHITISHPRNDVRIYQRICKPLTEYGLNIILLVSDGMGDEKMNNLKIFDLGKIKNKILNFSIFQIKTILLISKRKSIVHLHEPILLPIGILIRLLGHKVIFDMHENLDLQIRLKKWIPTNHLRFLISIIYRKVENTFLKLINGVTVPQPIMIDMYKSQNNKIISFANYYVGKKIKNKKQLINNKNYKNLLYAGSISIDRGLLNMIKMMEFLPNDYQLNIAGKVSDIHKQIIPIKLRKRIIFHGYLNQKDLKKLYIKCGIGLIMFNNVGQYFMSYSLKLFEYINFGMFIILPNFGEWVKFNDIYRVGINLDSSNPKLCADKIKKMNLSLLKNKSMDNLKVSHNFDWEFEIKKLIKFYDDIYNNK